MRDYDTAEKTGLRSVFRIISKFLRLYVTVYYPYNIIRFSVSYKFFIHNKLTLFCKLDHFINISNICCIAMK
jgi:formate hydrogenlyase subunit 6/NADH:ubiquinone oxidoreductase subunit I